MSDYLTTCQHCDEQTADVYDNCHLCGGNLDRYPGGFGTRMGLQIELKEDDAIYCSASGDGTNAVNETAQLPYVKRQLDAIDGNLLRSELYEYGAWTFKELRNHTDNLKRWLWLCAGQIKEEYFTD